MEMLDSRQVHDGHTIDVAVKRYRRADGNEVTREVVEHPGSVAILAYDEEAVYLVRQPREAVEADGLLEIPAGTLEPGEDELACARRELAEEVGLAAADWRLLKRVHTSPGVISEVATIFAATGLAEASGEQDADEQIEVVRLPRAELEAAIAEITDATTLIALLLLGAE
ncbi:MAG TPA: NUDIX hydrolase [Solirubrobacterales bacterium]|nr:NUDIX hydrolase [Solirubrobacterales bacterium]